MRELSFAVFFCVAIAVVLAQQNANVEASQTPPTQTAQPGRSTAQSQPSTPTAAPAQSAAAEKMPQANPTDVRDGDAIVKAVYDVISGPAGQKRDWQRFRSLFWPGARLIPALDRPSGAVGAHVLTIDEYISRSEPFMLKEGFFESEIARHTDSYGHVVQVFSTYESRHRREDSKPFARGINSIQLLCGPERCWVMNIFWQGERPDTPIPDRYLKSDK